jgi:hypothetical protein
MCIFNDYIRMQEELKDLQKETIQMNKLYNNELKLFQKDNIIDSSNAERVKEKYDDLQKTNDRIFVKENEIVSAEKEIEQYLVATNGMAIRYPHTAQGLPQPLIFEMETNTYGELKVKMTREI